MERWEMLRLVRRLCLAHKDDLLAALCPAGDGLVSTLDRWFGALRQCLEGTIRATGNRDGREAMAMALLRDADGCGAAVAPSLAELCRAWRLDLESRVDSVLWNTLSQFLKRKMDELDGYAGGHGTHVLQARRRLERMAKDLTQRKAAASPPSRYGSLAELAADMALEVRRSNLTKQLPATPTKILEYLYESQAATAVTEDPWDETLMLGEICSPETWIQLEQCLALLPKDLHEAMSIALGLSDEPVFLNDDAYFRHYGVGREAMRKRAAKARNRLLACLCGDEADAKE
jgi:hypothetical protein